MNSGDGSVPRRTRQQSLKYFVELIEKRNMLSQSGSPTTDSVNIGEDASGGTKRKASEDDDLSCPSEQKNNEEGRNESSGRLVPQLAEEGEKHKKMKLNHGNCSNPIIISGDEVCEVDILTPPEEKEQVSDKETLPLTFQFEDEEPLAREKEDWEKEADDLFAEMNMCIGFTSPPVSPMQSENVGGCEVGNHQLILDEQIGLICEDCSHVHLEIKYIFPPFAQRTRRRY